MGIKVDKLLLYNPDQSSSIITVNSFFPNQSEIEEKGQLFTIIELKNTNKKNFPFINSLLKEIGNSYYEDSRYFCDEEDFIVFFERQIKILNDKLLIIFEKENKLKLLRQLNILIGVIRRQELIISEYGDIFALLFYKNKNQSYQVIDILDNLKNKNKNDFADEVKIFSTVVSGNILADNKVIICNQSLLDYISWDKIKQIIIQNTPTETVAILTNILWQVSEKTNFGAIIFDNSSAQKPPVFISQNSITQLQNTEETTEKLLSASLKISGQKFFRFVETIIHQIKIIFNKYRPGKNLFNFFSFIGKNLYQTLIKKKSPISIVSKIKRPTKKSNLLPMMGKKLNLLNLKPKQKIILITVIFLIFALSFSLFYANKQKNIKEQENIYNELLIKIETNLADAEANLIFNNKEAAKNYILTAQNIFDQIPSEATTTNQDLIIAKEKTTLLLNKLRGVREITEPNILIDLAGVNFFPNNFVSAGNNFILFDANGKILKLDPISKTTTEIILTEPLTFYPIENVSFDWEKKQTIFSHKNKKISLWDESKNNFSWQKTLYAINEQEIIAMNIYNKRLYILDITANQIFRHDKTADGFDTGKPWITEQNLDLRNVVSFAIDGTIFLLKSSGQIQKLSNGKIETFRLQGIDPEFSAPTKIYTDTETNYLYILDPNNNRLVILDKKTGILTEQIYSAKFDNLLNFSFSSDKKKIYLLNGSTIYEINLSISNK